MRTRCLLAVTTMLVLAGALFAGVSLANSRGRQTSEGAIHIYLTGSLAGKPQVVITGAFADAGLFVEGGNKLSEVVLSKGSIKVDDHRGYAQEALIFGHLSKYVNAKTCAFSATYTATSTLRGGTGAYAGISGALTITNIGAGVFPKLRDGKCNEGQDTRPIGFVTMAQGPGTASFK